MEVACFFPERETLQRADGLRLTRESFAAEFLRPHQPVMLSGLQTSWHAGKDRATLISNLPFGGYCTLC